MNPIPILHIKDSSGIFGSERVILTLFRNIDPKQFTFNLVCMRHRDGRSNDFIEMAKTAGITVFTIDVNRRLEFKAIKNIRQIIKQHKIELLHAHDYKSDLYGLLASINTNTKRVLTSHGSTRDSITKKIYLEFDEKVVYPLYDRIIAVSKDLGKSLLKRKVSPNKLAIIQNGLDFNLLNSQPTADTNFKNWIKTIKTNKTKIVAVVGRLFPDKGHILFLKALQNLIIECPDLKALIVGDGPEKETLFQYIKTNKLEDNVYLCGFVSDMPSVYEAIDCLVIPSLTEGLPYTLLESMYYSVPVLATSVGDIPCLIKNSETGILITPGDENAILKGLKEIIYNPGKSKRMAAAGYELVTTEYSASTMGRQTEELYMQLISE